MSNDFAKHFISGSDIIDRERVIIPFSPKIDFIIGGGIQEGSFVVLTGVPKLGKTTAALTFAASAQNELYSTENYPTGRKVYVYNIEGRIKSRDLVGIKNLKTDNKHLEVIESIKGNILYAEDYLDIAEKKINEEPNSIHIIDSFSQLCTRSRRDADIGDRFRDDTPLLLSNFCKRVANVLPVNDTILIGITHLIANQGQGMKKWVEASGRKIQYQMDYKLRGTHITPWMNGDTQVGQTVHWECDTSALGPPGMKCESWLRYGEDIDIYAETFDICKLLGKIKKKGSWFEFPNGEKVQGFEKGCDFIKNNPDIFKDLEEQYKKLLFNE